MPARPTLSVCTFKLRDVAVEIEGEKGTVEHLYARIENDLQSLIDQGHGNANKRRQEHTLYVYSIGEKFSKVYAVPSSEIAVRAIGNAVVLNSVDKIYVDEPIRDRVIADRAHRTLWATMRSGEFAAEREWDTRTTEVTILSADDVDDSE